MALIYIKQLLPLQKMLIFAQFLSEALLIYITILSYLLFFRFCFLSGPLLITVLIVTVKWMLYSSSRIPHGLFFRSFPFFVFLVSFCSFVLFMSNDRPSYEPLCRRSPTEVQKRYRTKNLSRKHTIRNTSSSWCVLCLS